MIRLGRRRTSERKPLVRDALRHIPSDGDLDVYVESIASLRRRQIVMLGWPLASDAPSGLWIAGADRDYIVYPKSAPAARKRAIVCHELAHMLLGHEMQTDGQGAELAALAVAPSIHPDVAARFLTRHGYADSIEAEAEKVGTRLAAALAEAEAAPTERLSRRLR
jgi:hypothetical protein